MERVPLVITKRQVAFNQENIVFMHLGRECLKLLTVKTE